jgi:hypothetical protein
MPNPPQTNPITLHPSLGRLDPQVVASGPAIPPQSRILLFSPAEWEEFINEWATSLGEYEQVGRTGGAGDKGCDVVGVPTLQSDIWDNFQCKHYDHPLAPGDIWIELGKVCFFTFSGAYTIPRRYRFVAPRDVGTSLASLLRKPADLKAGLLEVWATKCQNRITSTQPTPLTPALRAHIESMDFAIFSYQPVLQVIEAHKLTPYYVPRFGLGLPQRPATAAPSQVPGHHETRYVQQLLNAYGDNAGSTFTDHATLPQAYGKHFNRSRESFYAAESLRNFSRDTLPEGTFELLQDQVYDGVVDVCESSHACGFTRLKATTTQAAQLSITSSPLIGKTDVADMHGICHQLANTERLVWVPQEGEPDEI